MQIAAVRAIPLEASFAAMFGGIAHVPATMLSPASHFQRIKRLGQYATLVEIESTDGFVGTGEAFGLPHPAMAAALVQNVIAPALIGLTVAKPADATAELSAYFNALGHTRGPAMEALSAVDIALWDLAARRAGQALCAYLGGSPGPVAAYVGSVTFHEQPGQSVTQALSFAAQGYGGVKLKVGRGVGTDMAHVEAVRDALDPAIALMLDANCGYDEATAIAMARALKPLNIAWLEEPVRADDPEALARVRAASALPIAAGENDFALPQFELLARSGAVDILQPNIARAGGVSGLLAIDAICARHGLTLAPHGVGSAVGVAAAVHTCRALKHFSVYEANRLLNPLRDDLAEVPLGFAAGAFAASSRPGHGIEPRREVLARYRWHAPRPEGSHAAR